MRDLNQQSLASLRRVVALQLWELGAVRLNLEQPFRLTSGNYSPIYLNCRQLISSPAFADIFAATARIIADAEKLTFDVLAGGETAGIPFAAFLARSFAKPMIYVRKAQKEHGVRSLVEGSLAPGSRVLLVEDLITDAGSKLHFVEEIERAKCTVHSVLVVFDRLQGGSQALAQRGIRLHSVTDMDIALEVAKESELLTEDQIAGVNLYLRDAEAWHRSRKLPYS